MSNEQKELLTKISEAVKNLSEVDKAYLLGRAEGMAEAAEQIKAAELKKEQ